MNGAIKHPLRVGSRLVWLAGELILLALNFLIWVWFRPNQSSIEARAFWLQQGCRRLMRLFNANLRVVGTIPKHGLLVSNHLSYLDVIVLSGLMPSLFVAKREVKHWPVFGWFAVLGGTLFADRERRTQVGELTKRLQTILEQGALVILFPEGTSSGGQTVLPFKSSLLEPATRCSCALSTSLIEFRLDDGDVPEEVCYWKDMTFLPHLLNLLSKRRIEVSVQFSEFQNGSTNRKDLARQLHAKVLGMKEASGPQTWRKGSARFPCHEPAPERRLRAFKRQERLLPPKGPKGGVPGQSFKTRDLGSENCYPSSNLDPKAISPPGYFRERRRPAGAWYRPQTEMNDRQGLGHW